jgi:RNA polymerase sigma-70 factor (ECF subfamily)
MTDEDWERLEGSDRDQPEFRAYQAETGRIIKEAVGRLPERQRLVFTLRHYKLMSISEIAQTIGCSPGAVKAHLSRGTAHLRDRLRGTVVLQSEEVGGNEM